MLYATCNATSIGSPVLIFLVKPCHYDDDGYVIPWLRSTMPSNPLAVVAALVRSAAEADTWPDVNIEVSAIDEANRRVPLKSMVARLAGNQNLGFVGLVG